MGKTNWKHEENEIKEFTKLWLTFKCKKFGIKSIGCQLDKPTDKQCLLCLLYTQWSHKTSLLYQRYASLNPLKPKQRHEGIALSIIQPIQAIDILCKKLFPNEWKNPFAVRVGFKIIHIGEFL